MNSTNYGILEGTKYEWPGGALTPRTVAQEGQFPMHDNDTPNDNLIPYGYCHCGCGEKVGLAKSTDARRGWVKGEPVKFRRGHHTDRPKRMLPPNQYRWDEETGCYVVSLSSQKYPGQYALIDRDDLAKVLGYRWHANRTSVGFYASSGRGGGVIRMHRLVADAPGGMVVDHINHDTLDNRRENLRIATQTENTRNRRSRKVGSAGYTGVRYRRGGYESSIRDGKKIVYLGRSQCPIEAAILRDVAAMELHGEFASLNFPELREVLGYE